MKKSVEYSLMIDLFYKDGILNPQGIFGGQFIGLGFRVNSKVPCSIHYTIDLLYFEVVFWVRWYHMRPPFDTNSKIVSLKGQKLYQFSYIKKKKKGKRWVS